MADISTWGWYSAQTWPGWNVLSQDNLTSNGNGRAVDPASYVEFTMRDFLGDGVIYDHDIDDVSLGSYTDYVFGPTLILDPQEIALYTNSTVVIGGQTYTGLDIQVTLFTDGTWGARLMDYSIPPGTHHDNVTSITLGTWNGVEYDGIHLSSVDQAFVCFTRGAMIATPDGPRAVETLRPLDMVCTLDAGPQPILWIGRRRVKAMGRSAPVEIAEGVLGNTCAVRLSPQHRLLLGGPEVRARSGHSEVLAAAKHLVAGQGIRRCPVPEVAYFHLLLPAHSLLRVDGLIAESMLPGRVAMAALGAAGRLGLLQRLPQLLKGVEGYGPTVRPCLGGATARALAGKDLRPVAALRRFRAGRATRRSLATSVQRPQGQSAQGWGDPRGAGMAV